MISLLRIIKRILRSTYRTLYFTYGWTHRKLIELKLKNNPHLQYNYDWTSTHYPNWEKWFAPYANKENLHYLEIGSHEGRSAIWFLSYVLTHPTAKLTAIDIMSHHTEPYLKHNINLSGFSNKVRLIKGCSEEVLPDLEENSFDIIYIDGNHKSINVLADSVYSWQLLKKDGLLLFDDYLLEPTYPKHKSCKYAIDLFLKYFSREYELLHRDYQVLVRKVV